MITLCILNGDFHPHALDGDDLFHAWDSDNHFHEWDSDDHSPKENDDYHSFEWHCNRSSQYDSNGHPCALGVNLPCAQVDEHSCALDGGDLSCALDGDDNPCVFYTVMITLGQWDHSQEMRWWWLLPGYEMVMITPGHEMVMITPGNEMMMITCA